MSTTLNLTNRRSEPVLEIRKCLTFALVNMIPVSPPLVGFFSNLNNRNTLVSYLIASWKSLCDLISDDTVVVASNTTAVKITRLGGEDGSWLNS